MTIEVQWRDYDVVVIGSGGAGSAAADAAAEQGARVLVVSKDPIGCSDTKISEGNATVRGSSSDADTVEELSDNLRFSGADLQDPSITETYARDNRDAYDWYRAHGLRPKINAERQGPYARPLAKGGHWVARSVGHANAGVAFSHAGWDAVVEGTRIDYLEDAWFLDLATETDAEGARRIVGALIYHAADGVLIAVRAPAVIVAAGGLSTLFFPKTDTMRGNTGDGYAAAARAGADLVDMEQVQFLPFCLTSPPSYEGLLIGEPSTASFLGVLRDRNGKVILDGVYMRTRAECSAAIMRAVADGRGTDNGGAYLDLTGNARPPRSGRYFMRYLETGMPSAYRTARQALGKPQIQCAEPWEVRPAAHYMMGGIRADADGASVGGEGAGAKKLGVTGLFAAGQSMGGVFGANRLGSTALTENVVFGLRAGRAAADLARADKPGPGRDAAFAPLITQTQARFGQTGGQAPAVLKLELQQAAWTNIGPARTAETLDLMDGLIDDLTARADAAAIPAYGLWNQAFIEYAELRNLLDVARAVTVAARERDASLGGHVRLDRPTASFLSAPYSTVVARDPVSPRAFAYRARRIARPRTPLPRLMAIHLKETWRQYANKALRLLPQGLLDSVLEKRYRNIVGPLPEPPAT